MDLGKLGSVFKMFGINPDDIKKQMDTAANNFAAIDKKYTDKLESIDNKLDLILNGPANESNILEESKHG